MQIPYAQHKELQQEINVLEDQWKQSITELKAGMSRTGTNQRFAKGRHVEERLKNMTDDPVFRRLNNIVVFRSDHHKLESVISTTFQKNSGGETGQGRSEFRSQALNDIRDAFTTFIKNVDDVLDITKEGQEAWDAALKEYAQSTAKIES